MAGSIVCCRKVLRYSGYCHVTRFTQRRWVSSSSSVGRIDFPESLKDKLFENARNADAKVGKVEAVVSQSKPGSFEYVDASRELDRLLRTIELRKELKSIQSSIDDFSEMLDDPDIASQAQAELTKLYPQKENVESDLLEGLLPRNATDFSNALIEIRPSAGGDEAGLFAFELYSMYKKFAQLKGWKWEELSLKLKDKGSLREGLALVSDPSHSSLVYGLLQFESGVHRVQRVPATEDSGRTHTSTVSVYVLLSEEDDESEFDINPSDLRIDIFRASGPGGQHVNKTESAVRIVHLPTKITVSMQEERSQAMNKKKALQILSARVREQMRVEKDKEKKDLRSSLVVSGERSEKVRTYNYARDQINDHRLTADDISSGTFYGIENLLQGSIELESALMYPLYLKQVFEQAKKL